MGSLDPTATASGEALFRYTVVSQVRSAQLAGQTTSAAVRAVSLRVHYQHNGVARRVSERTLYRWLALYKNSQDLASLEPTPRPRTDSSKILSAKLLAYLVEQRQADPDASIPELIRRAEESGVLEQGECVIRQTCWRALQRMGISTLRRKKLRDRDTRPFAYPHRLDMLLADGKYFRVGARRLRRVALFFLDDATRYGLHVVVGNRGERAVLFLKGLYEVIRKYGIADIYYLDKGPGFIAEDTVQVIGNLKKPLIHGETAYPEGRGKIERFNQRVKAELLRNLDRRPDVDPDCRALELRLRHYLSQVYNYAPHDALGNDTPHARFHADPKPLCLPEDDEELRRLFLVSRSRRVAADHTIPISSTRYEVPRGYAGHRVTVYRHVLENKVLFRHDGRFIELAPADPIANARARRGRRRGEPHRDATGPRPKTAAELRYDRDFPPLVDPDGGFQDPEDKE
jgi:transposase InsO family protein